MCGITNAEKKIYCFIMDHHKLHTRIFSRVYRTELHHNFQIKSRQLVYKSVATSEFRNEEIKIKYLD